ncbi:hypothetical protein SAMN04487895_104129 [Paenibacillus sophorae]|uniref:Uncharacterized protein n=1 Tax=Paenibacillus sophorae TaxID=1333845 RepID=A0A1H8L2V3_9BACL|nr:hypothetical protein SAMN04487895_104129 [Paenibacillus sophorae]
MTRVRLGSKTFIIIVKCMDRKIRNGVHSLKKVLSDSMNLKGPFPVIRRRQQRRRALNQRALNQRALNFKLADRFLHFERLPV